MKRWASIALLGVFLALASHAQAGPMWKYTDAQGQVHFTDRFDSIPPELRSRAEKYVPRDAAPATLPRTPTQVRRPVESYSQDEARALLLAGKLTEEEVRWLVDRGVLRTTELGDAIRFAAPPTTASQLASAPAFDAQASGVSAPTPWRALLELIETSPKWKYSLMAEAGLLAMLIVALPFILRRYQDAGTRRIVKASLFLIFVILSSVGNLLLFRDEFARAFQLKQALIKGPKP